MKGLSSSVRTSAARVHAWLPETVDRRVRVIAWFSLVAQILIVGTGGAVRLTGSGLGCPTWPRCTADSFVSTPEQGIHGIIEFGNRLLTFALVFVAILAFLYVLRVRHERPDLFALTLAIGAGIPAQAVLGGITVLTGLDPYLVGAHFVVSVALVALATIFVYRVYYGAASRRRMAPPWYSFVAGIAALFVGITILVGIITTGSGPHAGDSKTPRNGLDPALLQHLHSYPAYITLGLTLVLVAGAIVFARARLRTFTALLLGIECLQIVVGISQARLGLPEILVGIHMMLACVLASAMTSVVLSLRSTAPTSESHEQSDARLNLAAR